MNRHRARGLGLLVALGLGFGLAGSAAGLPSSVFVIHCEPTNAQEVLWLELVDWVAMADAYHVPLTILFTAQWAEMILADPAKTAALQTWLDEGHEIGCHHHGYWGTKDRGATWDGYTNTPLEEIEPRDRAKYRGTMGDYMALLDALPGQRRTGCLGTDERDAIDWPCTLDYSTSGHAVADATSMPTPVDHAGCQTIEIGHGLLPGAARGAMNAAYLACDPDRVFGVNGHVYNAAEFAAPFEAWFRFLASLDPEGETRFTVAELLDLRGL